jgi:acyl carrier protein
MMNELAQDTFFPRVEEIILQQVGDDVELSPETDLLNELGVDSLELVELGLKMERAFGTRLPIGELRVCVTIEDIVQLIYQRRATQAA